MTRQNLADVAKTLPGLLKQQLRKMPDDGTLSQRELEALLQDAVDVVLDSDAIEARTEMHVTDEPVDGEIYQNENGVLVIKGMEDDDGVPDGEQIPADATACMIDGTTCVKPEFKPDVVVTSRARGRWDSFVAPTSKSVS